jgi:hypothetical protein
VVGRSIGEVVPSSECSITSILTKIAGFSFLQAMFAPMKDPSARRDEEVIAFEAPFGAPQSCRQCARQRRTAFKERRPTAWQFNQCSPRLRRPTPWAPVRPAWPALARTLPEHWMTGKYSESNVKASLLDYEDDQKLVQRLCHGASACSWRARVGNGPRDL